MSDLKEFRTKVKKLGADLKSNKDIDDATKKKMQYWLDQIDDKLADLGPRRLLLENQILKIESLEDEVKDYNRDQGPLKDNAYGMSNVAKEQLKKTPKAAFLKDMQNTCDQIQALSDLKMT
jgi:hypothetical protein